MNIRNIAHDNEQEEEYSNNSKVMAKDTASAHLVLGTDLNESTVLHYVLCQRSSVWLGLQP